MATATTIDAGAPRRPWRPRRVDAHALARELAGETHAEVRFSAGSRALYANDASVYRQVPIGVVIPRRAEDVVAAVGVCRRHGAPLVARGCGTGLAGQTVNTAVLFDFSKYLNELLELDPRAPPRAGPAGDRARLAARRRRGARADLRARSRHALALHAGRHAGQQLVRDALDDRRRHRRQRRGARRAALRRHAPDAAQPTWTTSELEATIARGGREGEIYARAARPARPLRRSGPRRATRRSRAASRATTSSGLLPENGFNVAARVRGHGGDLRLVLEADLKLIKSPSTASLVLIGYEDCPTGARPGARGDGVRADRARDASTAGSSTTRCARASSATPSCCPTAAAGCWSSSARTTTRRQRAGRALRSTRSGRTTSARRWTSSSTRTPTAISRDLGDARGRRGQLEGAGRAPRLAVVGGRGRAARAHRRVPARARASCATGTARGSPATTDTSATAACTRRIDWDFLTPEGGGQLPRFMEEAAELVAGKYGGSLSGEHGDGQARAELLDRMFGPELVEAFGEFKAIWDPDGA